MPEASRNLCSKMCVRVQNITSDLKTGKYCKIMEIWNEPCSTTDHSVWFNWDLHIEMPVIYQERPLTGWILPLELPSLVWSLLQWCHFWWDPRMTSLCQIWYFCIYPKLYGLTIEFWAYAIWYMMSLWWVIQSVYTYFTQQFSPLEQLNRR